MSEGGKDQLGYRISSWLPPAVWAALIYTLSGMPNLKSGLECDFFLRKVAHVTEYFILTWLLVRAIRRTWTVTTARVAACSAGVALLYAASDEFHQTFIAGRHAALTDVMIDAIGILLCAAWAWRRSAGALSSGIGRS